MASDVARHDDARRSSWTSSRTTSSTPATDDAAQAADEAVGDDVKGRDEQEARDAPERGKTWDPWAYIVASTARVDRSRRPHGARHD
jgi:hypothetical protein